MSGKPAKTLKDKVKLSQLRALVAVAETGSFSEAAFQIEVSQSTISHSIAALEEALGVVLVHRGRQRASLTPVGDRIYAQAQQTLNLIDDMGQAAAHAKGVEGGLVRVAAFRSMASEILPEVIARLKVLHPTLQVSILEFESTPTLTNALLEGKADCSVAALLQGQEFETFQIMEDPFIALVPPNRPDIPTQLTWEDLRQQPLITSSSDCCKIISAHLRNARPPIDVNYFIANDSTAVSMTRQGLGITLLPKLAAQPIPAEVRTAQLPFSIARPLGVSWLKETWLTPAAYAFLDVFKDLFQNSAHNQANYPDTGRAQRYGVEHEKTAISATRHY